MKYWENVNGELKPVIIHFWLHPIKWWREWRSWGPANYTASYADSIKADEAAAARRASGVDKP